METTMEITAWSAGVARAIKSEKTLRGARAIYAFAVSDVLRPGVTGDEYVEAARTITAAFIEKRAELEPDVWGAV